MENLVAETRDVNTYREFTTLGHELNTEKAILN